MSVAALRGRGHDPVPAVQLQALAVWRAQPGALMMLGRTAVPLPKAGSARMLALPGVFRAEVWSIGGNAGYAVLAAIRLPQAADRANGGELTLRGARSNDRKLHVMLVSNSEASDFGRHVASIAGENAARLTRFMLDVMHSDDAGEMLEPRAVLAAFLASAARTDGCVELIMHVPQRCVVLQGWGMRLSEPVELLLPNADSLRHAASCGEFARSDLAAPATGSILALPHTTLKAMTGLERVYLLSGNDLLCRNVVEPCALNPDASIAQIRHLLPRVRCPAPLQNRLRNALEPQFNGRDTLNGEGRPVRAAVDMALAVEGGSAYISGWVFDPSGLTVAVHLCAEDFTIQLDENWVRVPRQDVSAAFAADPAFPVPLGDEWGFAVATPHAPSLDQSAYLRFTFAEGDLAFVPIRLEPPDEPAVLAKLFATVDMHKRSALSIIERHLAPFVAGLPLAPGAPSHVLFRGPLDRARAIVVPLRAARLPRSFVSNFLLDPATSEEQIIFVCGKEWSHSQVEALTELIRFYVLPASIIGVSHTPLPAGAVNVAAVMSQAESFLLASPGLVGVAQQWRDAMHRSAGAEPVACPTVLFEDRSVRFAGPTQVNFLDRAPFASVHAPLLGAPAESVGEGEPVQAEAGTFACCLIRRAALPALSEAARLTTEAAQEAAFFLSLRRAGLHGTWMPAVRVTAPEEDPAPETPAARLIDGWILRKTWGGASHCAS